MMQVSSLLNRLPPYAFDRIYSAVKRAEQTGKDVINLAAGAPDLSPPKHALQALLEAIAQPDAHQYPSTAGEQIFRESIAAYYRRRFHVTLNPDEEITVLHGSKEGMARLALAILNRDDLALVPDPAYPGFSSAVLFSGGRANPMPLLEANSFLPNLEDIASCPNGSQPRLMFLNYPNVPTGVVAPRTFFSEITQLAIQKGIVLCNDAAYCDMYYGSEPPSSLLEAPGAMEIAVELGTLSNTYQVPGWRIGYAVGNRKIIGALKQVEAHLDSGVFRAIQRAAAAALSGPQDYVDGIRAIYRQRRDIVLEALRQMGLDPVYPEATCYVWVKLPPCYQRAESFCEALLDCSGLLLLPGNYLGIFGEGYFRISLTAPEQILKQAMTRLADTLEHLAASASNRMLQNSLLPWTII